MLLKALLTGALLAFSNITYAEKTHVLFEMTPYEDNLLSEPLMVPSTVSFYADIVNSLQPGDRITFTDRNTYTVGKKRGDGKTGVVFDLLDPPGEAIRIPKLAPSKLKVPTTCFINFFVDGSVLLKRLNCPSVDIYHSLQDQYVRVERLPDNAVFFETFIENPTHKMKTTFIEFARKYAGFSFVWDFNYNQVAYLPDEERWTLFDWTSPHRTFLYDPTDHPFRTIYPYEFWYAEHLKIKWVNELYQIIHTVIQEERRRIQNLPIESKVIYHPALFAEPFSTIKMTCAEMLLEVKKHDPNFTALQKSQDQLRQ